MADPKKQLVSREEEEGIKLPEEAAEEFPERQRRNAHNFRRTPRIQENEGRDHAETFQAADGRIMCGTGTRLRTGGLGLHSSWQLYHREEH